MSLVVVQLGQCGNQMGAALFDRLFSLIDNAYGKPRTRSDAFALESSMHRYFRPTDPNTFDTWYARAILADTEPKVIKKLLATSKQKSHASWKYHPENIATVQVGSANNWAFGYYQHGKNLYQRLRPRIHHEVNECADFGGFLVLGSLAGGTGSGLSGYFTEQLRRDFPEAFILNAVVWPYMDGEVIIQNYNILLTLSKIYPVTDGVIVLQNDHLEKACKDRFHLKNVSFTDLNFLIATYLSIILLPCQSLTQNHSNDEVYANSYVKMAFGSLLQQYSQTTIVWYDLVRLLIPHPAMKFLHIYYTPMTSATNSAAYTNFTLSFLFNHVTKMNLMHHPTDEKVTLTPSLSRTVLSSLYIVHGRTKDTKNLPLESWKDHLRHEFSSLTLRNVYKPGSNESKVWHSPIQLDKSDIVVAVVSNSTAMVSHLRDIMESAFGMYKREAFLYQYLKVGAKREEFDRAFWQADAIIEMYENMEKVIHE